VVTVLENVIVASDRVLAPAVSGALIAGAPGSLDGFGTSIRLCRLLLFGGSAVAALVIRPQVDACNLGLAPVAPVKRLRHEAVEPSTRRPTRRPPCPSFPEAVARRDADAERAINEIHREHLITEVHRLKAANELLRDALRRVVQGAARSKVEQRYASTPSVAEP
jgi:hypothetical protein